MPSEPQETKVGIAIYAQQGLYGRVRNPHWALALHHTSFDAQDVRVYHVRSRSAVWSLCHEVRDLRGMGDLIGVLHVGDIPGQGPSSEGDSSESRKAFGMDVLDSYIKKFPPTKDGDDPSNLLIWSCESYVIRILAHLNEEDAVKLPCKPEDMYEYTKARIMALKAARSSEDKIVVIPYAE